MTKAAYKKALAILLRAEGLSDDMVRIMLRNMASFHTELRAMLLASDMTLYEVNILMAKYEELSLAFTIQMMQDAEASALLAYQRSIADIERLVLTFEISPYGIALPILPGAAVPVMAQRFAISNTLNLIQNVTVQMTQAIKAEILQGLYLQRRPFQVMQRISHVLGLRNISGFRELGTTGISAKAESIVRTEMMSTLSNAANNKIKELGQTFPDLLKIWISTGDWRTRDSHLTAHGQQVKWDEYFVVGGETCECPLDLALSARERVRCRCKAIPYREEWGSQEELIGDLDTAITIEKERRKEL